jgi:hypothetical protein
MRSGQIIRHSAWNAGIAKATGQVMSARLGPTLKFAQDDLAMVQVKYYPGFDPVQADEAKASHDSIDWRYCGQLFLIAKSILQGKQNGVGAHERWKQPVKLIVGRCFESNKHQVADSNLFRRARTAGLNAEVPLRAANLDPVPPHGLEVRAKQKMHIVPGTGQFRAVKAAHRPTSHDRDFHLKLLRSIDGAQTAATG